MKGIMRYVCATTFCLLIHSLVYCQTDGIKIRIWLTDSVGRFGTLYFGVHPNASDCVDDSLGEFFGPTECGLENNCCAQFAQPFFPTRCVEDSFPVFSDFRTWYNRVQADTYRVVCLSLYPITIHWQSDLESYYHSAQVVRKTIDSYITIADMLAQDSVTIAGTGARNFWIITNGPKLLPVRIDESSTMPLSFRLDQNYPNPFNPVTDVRYEICDVGHVSLTMFDVLGREVAALVDEVRQPGEYTVRWDALDQPSGVYLYRLAAGSFVDMKKLVLLR